MFGSLNVDLVVGVERLPVAGQTLLARDELRTLPGGKGANQAVAAARDGAHVVLAGAVGQDALAEIALGTLRAAGVDVTRVRALAAPTGCALICTDVAGRNQIVVARGANARADAAQVEEALLHPATSLVQQMETTPEATAALLRRARARGARTILNLAPAAALPEGALRDVDVLVVNEDEGAWLGAHLGCGPDAAALHAALGQTAVIRTLGAAGAEWCAGPERGHVAAPATEVRDTTGAGDCFVGVLAAALDRGAPLAAACRRATAAASLACTRAGAQEGMPARAEIDAAAR
ncbi:MAG TPA: ribokinase [Anaeromyxobacter sp.]|nr:ribokinase [Anaeromyxobacter sp.]